jgi:ADP-ribose pyrophosphatase YjhB (NUDIX family)
MHHIQRNIILTLARTSPLRFSDLQPPRTPNNTFTYHLKKLIDSGYIEMTKSGYVPTRKALKLVANDSTTSGRARTPGVLTMIVVQSKDGDVLLLNRNRKPFQGWYGIPGGLIHLGETAGDAALREMTEKTTLVSEEPLDAAGVIDLRYVQPGTKDIFLHVLGLVYTYHYAGAKKDLAGKVTPYGKLTWSSLKSGKILPEVFSVKELVDRGNYAYTSANFIEPPHFI